MSDAEKRAKLAQFITLARQEKFTEACLRCPYSYTSLWVTRTTARFTIDFGNGRTLTGEGSNPAVALRLAVEKGIISGTFK